jgi:hypothetical protein
MDQAKDKATETEGERARGEGDWGRGIKTALKRPVGGWETYARLSLLPVDAAATARYLEQTRWGLAVCQMAAVIEVESDRHGWTTNRQFRAELTARKQEKCHAV